MSVPINGTKFAPLRCYKTIPSGQIVFKGLNLHINQKSAPDASPTNNLEMTGGHIFQFLVQEHFNRAGIFFHDLITLQWTASDKWNMRPVLKDHNAYRDSVRQNRDKNYYFLWFWLTL